MCFLGRLCTAILLIALVQCSYPVLGQGQQARRHHGLPSTKSTSRAPEKSGVFVGSATSAVIQTVQAPVAEKRLVTASTNVAVQGPPSSLNEIPSSQKAPQLVPISYEFSYGTPSHSHIQNKRPDGIIEGRYVIHAPDGQHRTVDYVADKGGFRAGVATNEPGTETILLGSSKMVSSAMTGVDAALKFGVRPDQQNGPGTKQEPRREPGSPAQAAPEAAPLQVLRTPQTPQPTASPNGQQGPLRIVDIQPLPAPLLRYEHVPYPVADPNLQVVHAQASAPAPIQAQPLAPSTQVGLPQAFVPLAATTVHGGVVGANSPAKAPLPTYTVLTPNYGPQTQVVQNVGPPRVEVIPAQPGLLQRPPVHTVSEVAHFSAPQLVQPVQQAAPLNYYTHYPTQVQNRVVSSHPAPPPAVAPPPAFVQYPGAAVGYPAVQQFLHPAAFQPLAPSAVHSANGNVLRFQSIQPTKDAQIFEVKTKVVDPGHASPPVPLQAPASNSVVVLPQHSSRHFLGPEPKPTPDLAQVRLSQFTAAHQRLPHPEQVLKSLPPPAHRPPPGPLAAPEPIVLLPAPPTPAGQLDPRAVGKGVTTNDSVNKFLGKFPGGNDDQSEVSRFFSHIKQHHLNEVNLVKKHEERLQTLASRVMPFLHMGALGAVHPPRPY